MSGRALLIVEDCEPVAQVLAAALAEQFETIQRADSLTAARARWRDHAGSFEMVICSLALPDGTGDDLRLWLNDHTPRRLPFIILAGSLSGVRRSRTDFVILPKPFLMKDLLQAINEARTLAASFPDLR